MNDLKDIERSIIKKFRSKIYRKFVRCISDFDLINEGDSICCCISGGKDSFLLAKCLQELKIHSKYKFDLKFLVMDPGYGESDLEKIKNNLKLLNIDAFIFKTDIFDSIKDSSSPCYLCARKRRGNLYRMAKELGCNKIALGHHFDDVIETILLNVLYSGVYKTMMPKLNSKNFPGMVLIRPLYYVHEEDIKSWVKYNNLEFINCACNITKKNLGKRLEVKNLIKNLRKTYDNIDINILNSSRNVYLDSILSYKKNDVKYNVLDNYEGVYEEE